MNQNPVLYEDSDMRIEHHPTSHEDHLLYLLNHGQELGYIIPSGYLEEFAITSRDRMAGAMWQMNRDMVYEAIMRGLSIDSLGLAMAKAYIENEKRYRIWKDRNEEEEED